MAHLTLFLRMIFGNYQDVMIWDLKTISSKPSVLHVVNSIDLVRKIFYRSQP